MEIDAKVVEKIFSRLDKLEHEVFGTQKRISDKQAADLKKYTGATGGIRLLADESFFDQKRQFNEVRKALEDKEYHYSKQAVQAALNNLSTFKGNVLVALNEKGRKLYAKRK